MQRNFEGLGSAEWLLAAPGCFGLAILILVGMLMLCALPINVYWTLVNWGWVGNAPLMEPVQPEQPQAEQPQAEQPDLTNAQWADANGRNSFAIESASDRRDCNARGWKVVTIQVGNNVIQECQFTVYR